MTKRMADAIYAKNLPDGYDAYLGYVNGNWPDWPAIKARFPNVPVYGLTVYPAVADGDGTDAEPGDATIAQTVVDTAAELARGVDRPIVYCPASWATQMVNAHTMSNIPREKYRLLTAHYGQGPHLCGPSTCKYGPGSDGTQWQNGIDFDESILSDTFITAAPHPGPPPPSEVDVPLTAADAKLVADEVILELKQNLMPGQWLYQRFEQIAMLAVRGTPGPPEVETEPAPPTDPPAAAAGTPAASA